LKKLQATLTEVEKNHKYEVISDFKVGKIPSIETYDDHRMAMAFAPVGVVQEIIIKEPEVVGKSYPSFWKHISQVLQTS
jgi:3-phosphoshikimate 1-carboxyvinyltransferase